MEWIVTKQREVCGFIIEIGAVRAGDDIILCLEGGQRPHIGCTVLSQPRQSLTGDGTVSSTSSTINIVGHKDEAICRMLSEYVCAALNTNVVCAGGFHIDDISKDQITEVAEAVRDIAKEITAAIAKNTAR